MYPKVLRELADITVKPLCNSLSITATGRSVQRLEESKHDASILQEWLMAKNDIQSPAPWNKQPQAPGHAGVHSAGKQLCGKAHGSFGRHQAGHKPAMCPHQKKANGSWATLRRSRKVILPLYSTMVAHLDSYVQF